MDYLVERNFDYAEQDGKPVLIFRVDGKKEVVPLDKTFDRKQFEKDAGITLDTLQRSYYDRLGPEGVEKNREELAKRRAAAQKPEPTTSTTTTPTTTTSTTTTPTTTQQPRPRPKPLTPNQEYQKAAAAARNVQDPEARAKAMNSVRDAGMKIWADKYKNTLAPEVVRRQERAAMLGRGDNTQSGYPVIKKYVKPSVEKTTVGEAYDVVLDYLLSEGHAETLEEAHYVMMQLDSEFIQNIIEN